MTAPGAIVCVDWRGPFFLRYIPRPDNVDRGLTVYRVEHRGEPVYIGCTKLAVPTRLHRHAHSDDSTLGAFLRQTPAAEIAYSVIENGSRALEVALIQNARPRFNRWQCRGGEVVEGDVDRRVRMAAMRAAGMTFRQIGQEFGITMQAASQALKYAARAA